MDKDLIGFILVNIATIIFVGALIYGLFLISNVLGFIGVGVLLTFIGFTLGKK